MDSVRWISTWFKLFYKEQIWFTDHFPGYWVIPSFIFETITEKHHLKAFRQTRDLLPTLDLLYGVWFSPFVRSFCPNWWADVVKGMILLGTMIGSESRSRSPSGVLDETWRESVAVSQIRLARYLSTLSGQVAKLDLLLSKLSSSLQNRHFEFDTISH